MFGGSKQMMFRHIQALQQFKLHQPLPMTPRESQQLLNLLTSSFRQQLDREHGRLDKNARFDPNALSGRPRSVSATPTGQTKRRRTSFSQTSTTADLPTDHHMHSILTNPLFSYDAKARGPKRDPMGVFEDGVRRGIMTIDNAMACLEAEKIAILKSSALTIGEGMRDSGAGAKVLKWLNATGIAENTAFLHNHRFVSILFQFMVAEGLDSHIWKWLQQEFKAVSGLKEADLSYTDLKAVSYPLFHLIKAETADFASLDTAYASFDRAVQWLSGLPIKGQRAILSPSGRFLCHESTAPESRLRRPKPSANQYSKFIDTVPVFAANNSIYIANLRLHHPTKADAKAVYSFLKSHTSTVKKLSKTMENTQSAGWQTINMGLEAAQLLVEQDKIVEARWIMNFLRETFPRQLGDEYERQLANSEDSSLELLQGLSLA
jgi:hypothetical protein